jgi:ABC-2 type transport system ATP-binding protein
MLALATYELTKNYAVGFWRKRPYCALDRLSLEVEAGEVFGFLGPNGAGKTTTLKLLMQLVYPTSGRAEIFGRPVGELAVKRRLGYLPENPYFYDYLTAEELLSYFAGLFGYSPAERRARASRLLDEVGIGRERRLQLRKFSKGMLQRVGIAQAIIHDPELVIFDEPMSGLDPVGRREVRDLILRLRDDGRTVLFSSHILEEVEQVARQIEVMVAGRHAASGDFGAIRRLMTDRPNRFVLRTADDRLLASALLRDSSVRGARLRSEGGIEVEASDFGRFSEVLPRLAREHGVRLHEVTPTDESLESVFSYLVSS